MIARISLSVLFGATLMPAAVRACSVCFAGDDDAITHAFNWSVGFLLAAPYAIVGTTAACLVIAYRRAAARRAALKDEPAIDQLIWTQEESAK